MVGDASVTTHEIEPLGHRRIGGRNGIVHFVDHCGNLERHLQHTRLSDFDALIKGLMLANQHSVFDVFIDLPAVGRMNFLDVDREEVDAITIGTVDAIEGPSLGPKGRSGIAAENQSHRPIGILI